MNAILEQINSTGKIFVEFALPMLVQSSVLILILLLTDFALRKKVRAVFRYWIWLLVLVKLVLPTSLSAPLSLGYFFGDQLAYVDRTETTTEPAEIAPAIVSPMIDPPPIEVGSDTSAIVPMTPTIEPAVTEPINPPMVSVTPVTWQGVIFLLWLTVVMAMGLLLLQRAIFVRGLVAQAKEANGFMTDTLESCRGSMGLKGKIGLKVSANATSPAVCGLFRPVILLPQNLTSSLSASQLQAVLLHELAHIRRGDLWVNLAQTLLQIIYFYNPLLWVANCIIRRVREQAVDEMVLVAMGEKAQQYPQTLVNVAKLAFKRPALSLRLIGVVESKSALTGRIKHILNRPMPKKAKLGILGLAVVIIAAAILLPMATCTPGPPSLVIKGVVKDAQTGKPIAGARVFDDGYGPEPNWEQIKADVRSEWGAITNSAGEYSFLTWPEHHSIKIEAPGYKAERRSLYSGHFVFNKKDEEIFDFAIEPEKATDSSGFKKTLPNGVTVELIGICEHPSEGKQWWQPDGTELSKEIRVRTRGGIGASGIPYNVAVKVTMPEDATFKWGRIKGATGGISLEALDSEDGPISNMRAFRIYIDEKLTATSIQLGVATGPWKTRARNRSKGSISTAGIVFSKAYESDGGVRIIVADEHLDLDYRITAIDTQGKEHLFQQRGGSAGRVRQTTALFHDIKLNQIEYFLFQTRPYEWVEFKNVSLKPNFKTDVHVEKVGAGNKAGQSPFAATLPNGVTVELVGVCDIPADGKQWWAADGSPLENVFWDGTTNREDAEDARQMVFRVRSNDSDPDLAPTASFQVHRQQQPPGSWSGAFFVRKDNQTLEELRGVCFSLHDDQSVADVSAVISSGPWKTQSTLNVSNANAVRIIFTNVGKMVWSEPVDKGGKTNISVTLTKMPEVKQIVATDKQGNKIHAETMIGSNWDADGNAGGMAVAKAIFPVPLSRIDRFHFRTRKAEHITFKNVSLKPNFKTDVQVEEESLSDFQVSDESKKFGAVDFEGYFVNSADGGLTLDQLWDDKNKDLRDADEILEIIRKGLRRYSGSGNILRWIGNLFIWGKNPQNEKAIELMYYASGSPNRGLYGDAIYFGLSVTKNKTPEILQAMVAVAMKTDDYYNVTGRILWGCRDQKDELIACLDPYLNSDDISIRQKAQDVKNYFMDSKAFMAKRAKEHEESVKQEYGNKLGQFKDKLLKGDSQTRLDTLKQLRNKGIMSIVDVSFLDAFQACIKDSDPEVRTTAARIMGNKFVWSGEPRNQQAIEILTELLDDPDRSTRYAAVYYGLSTVRNPSKELIRKMLITILDDREINYYGRVIWGIRRNKQACVEILKEWMNQSEQDNQRAVKAYEIYEDVSAQQLPDEYAQRFAGQKSNAYEGLVAMCFHAKPVSKEKLQKQFLEHLANGSLMQKVLDFYIIETRETAVGMFTCDNLANRNAIRDALTNDKVFQVAGYMHGKIGPTGSGWVDSLQKFRKRNELNRVSLPKPGVLIETGEPQSLIFHGLDLTAVPHTTNSSKLPDLFEERPLGSKSYHIQKDVTAIYSGLDGTVYFIPRRNIFYVQHDKLGSSTLTYYGPFEGNPVQVLNLQPSVQVEGEEAEKINKLVWGQEANGLRAAVEFMPEKESYSLGERVEIRFHIQNVSGHDIQIANTKLRQDHTFVKDREGNNVLVYHTWFSGWARVVRHILRPGGTIVLESFALGFGDADDPALVRPMTKPYTSNVVRCEPGKYFIHYNIGLPDVHRVSNVDEKDNVPQPSDWQGSLKTGLREVVITPRQEADLERFKLVLNQESMQSAVLRFARKYRVRICFEQIDFNLNPALRISDDLVTGTFNGSTIPKLLNTLTRSTNGRYTWTLYSRTYVVHPEHSHLMFMVRLWIGGTPLEDVVRRIFDQGPDSENINIKLIADHPIPETYSKGIVREVNVGKHYAMFTLCRAVEETGKGDIAWTFTQERGQRQQHLTLHYLPEQADVQVGLEKH